MTVIGIIPTTIYVEACVTVTLDVSRISNCQITNISYTVLHSDAKGYCRIKLFNNKDVLLLFCLFSPAVCFLNTSIWTFIRIVIFQFLFLIMRNRWLGYKCQKHQAPVKMIYQCHKLFDVFASRYLFFSLSCRMETWRRELQRVEEEGGEEVFEEL